MRNAYHGDTVGAVSVGGIELFHSEFEPLLFPTRKVSYPYAYRFDGSEEECAGRASPSSRPDLDGQRPRDGGSRRRADRPGAAGMIACRPGSSAAPPSSAGRTRCCSSATRWRTASAHRADVRVRARGRHARPDDRRQGHHGRLPAARGDVRDATRSTRLSSASTRTCAPSTTATPTPGTSSPAPPRLPASTCSSVMPCSTGWRQARRSSVVAWRP